MVKYSNKTIQSFDDTSLYLHCWTPAEEQTETAKKANVVIVHGYLEHAGRYAEFAEYLCQNNITVTAFDCRGHGKSSGQRAYVGSYNDYIEDLKVVLTETNQKGVPLFVVAHSNGALIVLHHFLQLSKQNDPDNVAIKGVILTSPWLAPADELPLVKIWASKILGWLLPKTSMPADEVNAETVTSDPQKQQEHRNDELILSSFTLGWARQAMNTQAQVLKELNKIPVPLLFLVAGQDKVASASTNKEFAEQLQQQDKTVVERKEDYHEILNEPDRKEVYDMIAKWIDEHLK